MFQRLIGPTLTAAGLLILLVSLLADVFGRFPFTESLGIGRDPGFGPQQITGATLGTAVLILGIWVWKQRGRGRSAIAASLITATLFVAGAIYFVTYVSPGPRALVSAYVEVRSIPGSAGATGHTRLVYGVLIQNVGTVRLYVDSVELRAFRDTAGPWWPQSEVVAVNDMIQWKQIDSGSVKGPWSVYPGVPLGRQRSIILPPETGLSRLHVFRASVFLGHEDPESPRVARSEVDWIEGFPTVGP